ncbi:hypothetical protein D3C87_701480 [compost metagenome]
MKVLVLLFLSFLGFSAQASTLENVEKTSVIDDVFTEPLRLRIVKIGKYRQMIRLFDAEGAHRLEIHQEWDRDPNLRYYNSKGQWLGMTPMSQDLHQRLFGLMYQVQPTCPLFVTVNRQTLGIEKLERESCNQVSLISFRIVAATMFPQNVAEPISAETYESQNLDALWFRFEEQSYEVPGLSAKQVKMSPELNEYIKRALRGVSEDCPLLLTLDAATLEILKVKATCDVLAGVGPYL